MKINAGLFTIECNIEGRPTKCPKKKKKKTFNLTGLLFATFNPILFPTALAQDLYVIKSNKIYIRPKSRRNACKPTLIAASQG